MARLTLESSAWHWLTSSCSDRSAWFWVAWMFRLCWKGQLRDIKGNQRSLLCQGFFYRAFGLSFACVIRAIRRYYNKDNNSTEQAPPSAGPCSRAMPMPTRVISNAIMQQVRPTKIRSIHADEARASETATDLPRSGRTRGSFATLVRARTDRATSVATVPKPRMYPSRPGLNLEAYSIVMGESVRRPRSPCECRATLLLRKGEVQIKYLNRSSNSASSESDAEGEKVCCGNRRENRQQGASDFTPFCSRVVLEPQRQQRKNIRRGIQLDQSACRKHYAQGEVQ